MTGIILIFSHLYYRWRQLISRNNLHMQLLCPLHLNNLKNSFRTFTNIAPVRSIGCSEPRPLISIILQAFTLGFPVPFQPRITFLQTQGPRVGASEFNSNSVFKSNYSNRIPLIIALKPSLACFYSP